MSLCIECGMHSTTIILLFCLAAYLLGSIAFAVWISKIFALPDPHSYGSGNPGATNVLRTGNKLAAALTLLGDGAKGYLAVALTQWFIPVTAHREWALALVALAVFFGHLYPLFHRFRGGKGVATAAGVALALNLYLGLAVLAVWLIVVAVGRIASLGSMSAALAAPCISFYLFGDHPTTWALALMATLLIWRHRENIERIVQKREAKIGRSR